MNNQPTPTNSASPESSPTPIIEGLASAGVEQPARVEPAPSSAQGEVSTPESTGTPVTSQLTPADVAAAMAAVPTPGAPLPTITATSAPDAALDVDLIEPEWVDQAEKVVLAHQGDPYGEEEAVEDLQQDYLKKRYGYSVTDPGAEVPKVDATKPELK